MGVSGKSLVCIGYAVSTFTLSVGFVLDGLLGFKGFIGKVDMTLRFSFGAH